MNLMPYEEFRYSPVAGLRTLKVPLHTPTSQRFGMIACQADVVPGWLGAGMLAM
jgi:hypothetical protein